MNRIFKIIEKIFIFICIISTLIGIFILFCSTHKNEYDIVRINKLYFITVNDNDMKSLFKKGDLLLIEEKDNSEYHINNIISYYSTDSNGNVVAKTSRIIDGYTNDDNTSYIFMVKADNNDEQVTVSSDDVIGEWSSNKISNGSTIFNFILSRLGFFLIVVIPFIVLFAYEFILLICSYKKINYDNI